MAGMHLDEETLDELGRRHVEFVMTRLASPALRSELAAMLRDGWEWLEGRPVADLLPPGPVAGAIVRALGEEQLRGLHGPALRSALVRTLDATREREAALGDAVPVAARAAIDELASKPGLVPDRLVREVLRQEAVEHALRDVMYDALREFHDTVNPFFADWGIPALLRWMPLGAGAVRSSLDGVRREFDRRLEPEMREFLLAFSRRATTHLADLLLARADDPNLVELRRNVVAFLYTQTPAELLAGVGDADVGRVADAVEESAVAAVAGRAFRDGLEGELRRLAGEDGTRTLGDCLEAGGVTAQPDFEAWAEALWPAVQVLVGAPAVRAFVERMSEEFYAGLRGDAG